LKIDAATELHQLPEPAARMIARRMRGNGANASDGGEGPPGDETTQPRKQSMLGGPAGQAGMGGFRPNGPPDFQMVVSRTPIITMSALSKGDAVMAVAMNNAANSTATVVILVDGVEAILTASPGGGGAATLLSSWNMSASQGEGESQ